MYDIPTREEVEEFVSNYLQTDLILHTSEDPDVVREAKQWMDNLGKPLLIKFRMLGEYDDLIQTLQEEK